MHQCKGPTRIQDLNFFLESFWLPHFEPDGAPDAGRTLALPLASDAKHAGNFLAPVAVHILVCLCLPHVQMDVYIFGRRTF